MPDPISVLNIPDSPQQASQILEDFRSAAGSEKSIGYLTIKNGHLAKTAARRTFNTSANERALERVTSDDRADENRQLRMTLLSAIAVQHGSRPDAKRLIEQAAKDLGVKLGSGATLQDRLREAKAISAPLARREIRQVLNLASNGNLDAAIRSNATQLVNKFRTMAGTGESIGYLTLENGSLFKKAAARRSFRTGLNEEDHAKLLSKPYEAVNSETRRTFFEALRGHFGLTDGQMRWAARQLGAELPEDGSAPAKFSGEPLLRSTVRHVLDVIGRRKLILPDLKAPAAPIAIGRLRQAQAKIARELAGQHAEAVALLKEDWSEDMFMRNADKHPDANDRKERTDFYNLSLEVFQAVSSVFPKYNWTGNAASSVSRKNPGVDPQDEISARNLTPYALHQLGHELLTDPLTPEELDLKIFNLVCDQNGYANPENELQPENGHENLFTGPAEPEVNEEDVISTQTH